MNIFGDISRVLTSFLVLVQVACSNKPSKSLEFVVIPEHGQEANELNLRLKFQSNTKDSFLFDRAVFSIYDPVLEDSDLLLKYNPSNILNALEHSQCMIESTTHSKRFFSNIQLFKGEVMQMKSILMLEPTYDTIRLLPNKASEVTINRINVNRLKNELNDDTIRIHYFFKASKEQIAQGYKSMALVSNWFSLKQTKAAH